MLSVSQQSLAKSQETCGCIDQKIDIVIIDDNKHFSEILKSLLINEGYSATCAHDGSEGLRTILKLQPRIVVLDIQMPVLNGVEVLRQMRNHPELNGTPVILASAERDVASHASHYSQTNALRKPFDLSHLSQLVHSILNTPKRQSAQSQDEFTIAS